MGTSCHLGGTSIEHFLQALAYIQRNNLGSGIESYTLCKSWEKSNSLPIVKAQQDDVHALKEPGVQITQKKESAKQGWMFNQYLSRIYSGWGFWPKHWQRGSGQGHFRWEVNVKYMRVEVGGAFFSRVFEADCLSCQERTPSASWEHLISEMSCSLRRDLLLYKVLCELCTPAYNLISSTQQWCEVGIFLRWQEN